MQRSLTNTNSEILSVAERLLRTRGYNGFSFGDIADSIGTTRANIHYYYRTKEDLGCALIEVTRTQVLELFDSCRSEAAVEQLKQYFGIFERSIDGELICLCGMLMAEDDALPTSVRRANGELVDLQLEWLEKVLEAGRQAGELSFDGPCSEQADDIFAFVHGRHIVSKFRRKPDSFSVAADKLLMKLSVG